MANHPYNNHREQQVAHRRVGTILSGSPAGAEKHAKGHAFSKLTSKSAAVRDNEITGNKSPQRFARGGNVKKADGGSLTVYDGSKDPDNIAAQARADARAASNQPTPTSDSPARPVGRTGRESISASGKVSGFARGGKVKHGGGNTNIAIVLPKGGGPSPGGPAATPLPMAGPGGPPPMGAPPPGMPPGPPGMPMRARGGRIDGEATKGNIDKWGNRAKDNSYFTGGAITGVGREEKAAHMKRRK